MHRRTDWMLAAAIALAGALWTRAQWLALDANLSQWSQDVAFFNQIFWSGSRGGPWASDLLLEPQGMLEMVHFHPVFWVIMPLYWLLPDPRTLLALNAIVVALAAWPLAALARAVSRDARFGLLAGVAYLLFLPTLSAAQADFRPMVWMIPGFATLALGAWTGRWRPLLIGAALICAAREESAYLLMFAGVVTMLRHRKQGAALAGVGALWFGVLWAFKGSLFFHFDPSSYAQSVAEPPTALVQERWGFVGRSLLSGYVLAPLGWLPALIGAPGGAWLWLDSHREWHHFTGPYVHLRSLTLATQAAAGTLAAGWVALRLSKRWSWAPVGVGVGMCLGNLAAFPAERTRHHARMASINQVIASPEHAQIQALLARVQPRDRVATSYELIAALSGRETLWNANHLFLEDAPPPHWRRAWPIGLEVVDTVVVERDDPLLAHMGPDWRQEAVAGSVGLWRRVQPFPDCPVDMVPIPGGHFVSGATQAEVGAADWEETWNLPRAQALRETDSYCIDRYEYPNQAGVTPRVLVTWEWALEDCQAQGKRLCTEDEWARACGGELGRAYPYGEQHQPGRCHDQETVGDHDALAEAGSYPACVSAWGVMDMEGNASEWVSDPHTNDPEVLRVLRGGTMWTAIYGRGCESRHAHEKAGPTNGDDTFRCCQ